MKKKLIFIMFILGMFLSSVITVNAATDITGMTSAKNIPGVIIQDYYNTNKDNAFKIPGEYSFTPLYNSKTTTELFGTHTSAKFMIASNTNGQYGIIYRNVGKYGNQIVDLKVTVKSTVNVLAGGYVTFSTGSIAMSWDGVDQVNYVFEFFKHNTNEPINIKGFITYTDVDALQGVIMSQSSYEKIFVSNATKLEYKTVSDNNLFIYCPIEYDVDAINYENGVGPHQDYMFTIMFSGSELDFSFMANTGYHVGIGIIGYSNAPLLLPAITKTESVLDKIDVTSANINDINKLLTEDITYKINFKIPFQMSTYYYDSLVLSDQLEDIFDIKNVKIINSFDNSDVTSLFNITKDNNKVVATVINPKDKDIYNQSYTMIITVNVKKDADLKPYLNNSKYEFKNKAILVVDDEIEESNEVIIITAEPELVINVPDTGIYIWIGSIIGELILIAGGYLLIKKRKVLETINEAK